MTILTQLFSNAYTKHLESAFLKRMKIISEPQNYSFTIHNYASLIESLGDLFQEFCRQTLVNTFQEIDQKFKQSEIRKRDYYVKDFRERTLVTPYGVITFKRTLYQNKIDGKCFTYLDRKLGLPRWDTYDPCIKAMICELYANQNSMIKVGEILGDRLFSPFSTASHRHQYRISRQTIHNTLRSSLLIKQTHKPQETTPEVLYIMADEKYIPLQKGNTRKVMVKSAVIFESVITKHKRTELVNKTNYSSCDGGFWEDIYDIVSEKYDIDKIKHICIMGDGATWIKQGIYQFNQATFSLDKFHFKQAINHISIDENEKSLISNAVIFNQKKQFKEIVQVLIDASEVETRKETIIKKRDYILSQWNAIQTTYQDNTIGCSMEAAISHNLASVYTSRPKAYKKEHLRTYLCLRNLHTNNVDIRKFYLDTLSLPRTQNHTTEKESFDFSMFEPKTSYDKSSTSNWVKGFISKN